MTAVRRDLTLNDGTQIWLRKDTGTVQSVKDWSETYVSSTGGGGHLSEGTGYVSAPTVTARSVHRQVFFLKYEDGTEKECDTNLINVSVGHQVTLVWGAKQGKDYGHNLGFYDHTTNTYAFYGKKAYNNRDFGKWRVGGKPLVAYLILLFVLMVVLAFQELGNGQTPTLANVLFYVFVLSILFLGIKHYRSGKFYKDLTSKALAFMREG
jgi:hypothetical protein